MQKKRNNAMNFCPVRLHLELQNEHCNDEEKRILMKYADSTENGTLTRDILIPSDMPLHNLHYAIQSLYGWQNSHLRCFRLEGKDYDRLTGGMVKGWMKLVGTLFQGLSDDEGANFWDDDYERGSFKVWLKKKYTGPYSYGGYMENYNVAQYSVKQLAERFPVMDVTESFHVLKRAPIMELTLQELNNSIIIDEGTDTLLERLEVVSVLASPSEKLAMAKFPATHKLYYDYDYGDGWVVEITKYDDSYDLLENGKISAEGLRSAEQLVLGKHKPVCIDKKGSQVVDDVGGMSGYTNFISNIYEGDDKEEKESCLKWAKSLGWSSRNISLDKLL